jgi:hypothetical protein
MEKEIAADSWTVMGGRVEVLLPAAAPASPPPPSELPWGVAVRHPPWLPQLRQALGTGPGRDMGLHSLVLEDLTVVVQREGNTSPLLRVEDLGLRVGGLHTAGTRMLDKVRFDLQAGGMAWSMDEGRVKGSLESFSIDHAGRSVVARGLHIAPTGDRARYAASKGVRFDAMELSLGSLRCTGFDQVAWLEEGIVRMDEVALQALVFDDYRDHRFPQAEGHRALTATQLRQAPMLLDIGRLTLAEGTVRYAELNDKASRPGRIALERVSMTVEGLNNMGSRPDPLLTLHVDATLLGSTPLSVQVAQPLDDPRDRFSYRLNVGRLDLTKLADFVEPVLFMRVRNGVLDTLRLIAVGNEDVSIGELEMFYTDLQVALLNKRTEDYTGMGNHLASLVANALVRQDRKVGSNADPVPLYFERWKDRGMANYMVKILASGVPGAIGLGKGKERREVRRTDESTLKVL